MQWRFNILAFKKISSKPVIKGSIVESIDDARKNISNYWRRVGGRQVYLKAIFKKILNWGLFYCY